MSAAILTQVHLGSRQLSHLLTAWVLLRAGSLPLMKESGPGGFGLRSPIPIFALDFIGRTALNVIQQMRHQQMQMQMAQVRLQGGYAGAPQPGAWQYGSVYSSC